MAYLTGYQYYENSGNIPEDANWGSYQYVSLEDIVNNFMLIYNDNLQLINNVNRYQVLFYAKRAIQELNYDAFKEIKVLDAKELNIDLTRKTKIMEINEPEQREKGEIIQDVDELIDCLRKSGVLKK